MPIPVARQIWQRLPRIERLTCRLAVGIALLVVVPVSAGLYAVSRHHTWHTIQARRAAADLENRLLESALRHQMMERDRTLMNQILREIVAEPEVRSVMIVDHEGMVRIASHKELVGTRFPRDSPTCRVCHSKPAADRERWILVDRPDGEILRSVRPIENRPECHRCHEPEQKFNGMLLLDISLSTLHTELEHDAISMMIGTAGLTLLLLGGVGLLVRRLVLVRVWRLRKAAQTIAAGDLSQRSEVSGGDMIAGLAMDFNRMANSLAELIGELRARESQMSGMMNSLDDGLLVIDADFRVVASNRSFCKRLGSHPEDLRGRDCLDAIGSEYPCYREDDCPAVRCLATGEVQREVFHRDDDDGGTSGRYHEVHASPVRDETGAVTHVVELWRDISDRVHEEERLAEIERLSSLGVLASGFSHEINTPLASMLTCAEGILGRLTDSPDGKGDEDTLPAIRESAEIIRSEVLRCRKITALFLRFARGIPPSAEPLDLGPAVESVISLANPTAREAGVRLKLESNGPIPTVSANTEVVQHVVLNLLINAIQSCGESGGEVAVSYAVGSDVRLQITDDGCGIAPELRHQLFTPLRSRKPGGTGLGLFLSRSFMRRFGGDVRLVETEVGSGTRLEVVFLRADGVSS